MDGSISDGSTSPSVGLSSPHSMPPSPNPDSSGMLSEPPGHPMSTAGTPPVLCPAGNGAISPKSIPPSLSPTSSGPGCMPISNNNPNGQHPRPISPGPVSLTGKSGGSGGLGGSSVYSLPSGVPTTSVGGMVMPRHDALQVASMALNAAAAAASRGNGVGYGGSHHHHHHHHHRMHTASPPGISGDGVGNECRLIDYRGAKVAAFLVGGEFLLCLPQAFELFLKHLVGGLHTVYTKLKRLDITPIVCNVEQVRILRGLGAIQPGVNRCKLLSCKDFDALYKDCTTARPGRPPKRASMVGMTSHSVSHAGLLKKGRLDGDYGGYENGHITSERLEKHGLLPNGYSHHAAAQAAAAAAAAAAASSPHINPLPFMALNHPGAHPNAGSILPGGMALPLSSSSSSSSSSAAAAAAAAAAANAAAANRAHASQSGTMTSTTRTDGSVIKDRTSSSGHADGVNSSRDDAIDVKDKFYGFDSHRLKDPTFLNGYFWLLAGASANGHSPVLNLSQNSSRCLGSSGAGNGGLTSGNGNAIGDHSGSEHAYNECVDDEDNDTEDEEDDDRDQDLSDNPDVTSTANNDYRIPGSHHPGMPFPGAAGDLNAAAALQGVSSIETLLRNIQGLLKVAADNARQQERQISLEKAEMKMDILREREMRENVEKQLLEEQRVRILYQKRLKREKRCRRRLHEQLENEMKKRSQYEDALRSTSGETLRLLNESIQQEIERERNSRPEVADHKLQDCPMSV